MKEFGRIKARKNGRKVSLSFVDRKVFDAAEMRLTWEKFEIVDSFWGYQIEQSVDQAMETARIGCGDWKLGE